MPETTTIAEAAHAEIVRLCNGGRWRMTIPVRPEDSDIVLSEAVNALDRVAALLAERDEWLLEDHPKPWPTGTVHSALVTTDEVRAALDPPTTIPVRGAEQHTTQEDSDG